MNLFSAFGSYLILLNKTFTRPEKGKVFWQRLLFECNAIGVESLGIVAIISLFIGAVSTINTAYQLVSNLVQKSIIGAIVSDTTILEFSPTIASLVLAGKVGSNIATELGGMRVSEQIDAMEVMGVNSAGFLILPKITASLFVIPCLIIISMGLSIFGGWFIGGVTGAVSPTEFMSGARGTFRTYTFVFAMIKTFTFSFIISSVSAYQGYYAGGSAIEVGRASTRAVVYSSVLILFSDYLLAQLLLD
ncbi:MAG: ABC transporter permease [Bacteroidetes bacterium]|nr:ABC transporter permease [Bacteroidota bacterium]